MFHFDLRIQKKKGILLIPIHYCVNKEIRKVIMSKLLIGLMLVYSINLVYSNRLPLEIYAVPDSKHQQIQTNHDNENHTKHKLKLTNEQRHSRALQQNVQVNHRILYQVGVSNFLYFC